ncbi:RNA polymerase [Pueribacillus theae]|uniref:RNA polymerase n=1 Tax=Pueribacillus theae TaxID=2171751 RepID=A0A2U1JIL3_9BACI|nr:sigma-70 family RNA polymerase sigma factor [Pueribacillus theae]PWA04996.1 RNA polymerase [Pueribacillus theae]
MAGKHETNQLLHHIKRGSRSAFDQFYEQHRLFVFHIAFSILKNRQEAEDICHDVFVEVFQKAGEYDSAKGSVQAWLAVKTKSRSLDYLKKKKPILKEKIGDLLSHVKEEVNHTEYNVMEKLEKEVVHQALALIPKDQRDVLYGAYFEERTQRELAQVMHRPLGTIKSAIRYGLNNLRKQKALLNWVKPNEGGKKNNDE